MSTKLLFLTALGAFTLAAADLSSYRGLSLGAAKSVHQRPALIQQLEWLLVTEADIIDGIPAVYGTYTKPGTQIAYQTSYSETTPVLARWEDASFAYDLVRTGDRTSFAVVLYSKRLEATRAANKPNFRP